MATNNAINVDVVVGGGQTYTFPAATDTLVGRASTDTLTNKTLTSAQITTNLSPTANDGAALGSTTKQFSDLFLAEGGVINWDNGDVTLTQSGNNLMISGGIFAFADQVPTTIFGSERVMFEDSNGTNSDFGFRVAGDGYAVIGMYTSAGTLGTPTKSADFSTMGELWFGAHDGTTYQTAAKIRTYTGSVTAGDVAGTIAFAVAAEGSTTVSDRAILNSTKFGPNTNDGIGLGSGSVAFSDLFLAEGGVINWDNGDATLTQASNVVTLAGASLNARVDPRVGSTTSSGTPTINTDNVDAYSLTAQAAAITSFTTNLSGTPTNFQKLTIRIKDNGTARAITWGASFEAKGVALPTTTVISKVLTVGFIYDTVTSKWGCVASAQEA